MSYNAAPTSLRKIAAIVLLLNAGTVLAGGTTLAPWLTQMGLTTGIESAANWGHGLILGDVDTGIVPNYMSFSPGQVSLSPEFLRGGDVQVFQRLHRR